MSELNELPESYQEIERASIPDCCILCKHCTMPSYWEFVCSRLLGEHEPFVKWNGLCDDFERPIPLVTYKVMGGGGK